MIARLAGVALDARSATACGGDPHARATAARWIAANALAARGLHAWLDGALPIAPRVFSLRAPCFAAVMAAIASVPVLVDAAQLPAHWRLALRVLGLPALDRSTSAALAGGVSVLDADGLGERLAVELEPHGYRVRVTASDLMLRA